ncbi:MAG: hypothetical protein AABW56_05470 [Nanoarchaeota archaeon]
MKKQEAEQYPLFKDYEFALHFGGRAGQGILLIPKKEIYVPKDYRFGLLALAPYLQEVFNENQSIKLWELIQEMEAEGDISLRAPDLILDKDKQPFLYSTLNRYIRHNIIKREGLPLAIGLEDVLSAGENWDKTRVYKMTEYTSDGLDFPPMFSSANFPEPKDLE